MLEGSLQTNSCVMRDFDNRPLIKWCFNHDVDFLLANKLLDLNLHIDLAHEHIIHGLSCGMNEQINVAPFFVIIRPRAKQPDARVLAKRLRRSKTNGLNLIRGEAHAESTKQSKLFRLFIDAAHNLEKHWRCITRIQK